MHWQPWYCADPSHVTRTQTPSSTRDVQGEWNEKPPQTKSSSTPQQHHEPFLFRTHTGVMRCLAQSPRGAPHKERNPSKNTP